MEFESLDCSSISIEWSPREGFTRKILYDKINLSEQQWQIIFKNAIPSGSSWSKYPHMRSIRIWEEVKLTNEKLYILSISFINKRLYSEIGEKDTPSTYIFIFMRKNMEEIIDKKGPKWLLDKIYAGESDINPWEDHLSVSALKGKYFTLHTDVVPRISDAWKFLEAIFVNEFFRAWPSKVLSIATLCTDSDDTEKFEKVGMLERDLKTINEWNYSTIVVKDDHRLSIKSPSVLDFSTSIYSRLKLSSFFIFILITIAFCAGYLVKGGLARNAVIDLNDIVIDLDNIRRYPILGDLYVKKDSLDNAIAEYKKTIDISPKGCDTYYSLSRTYSLKGNRKLAIKTLNDAILCGQNYINQAKEDNAFNNIRDTSEFQKIIRTNYK